MRWFDALLLLLLLLSVGVAVHHLLYVRRNVGLDDAIKRAVEDSAMRPTYLEILDLSPDDGSVCDRMIRVMPMDWYVWACYGQVFVLNPEGAIGSCHAGDTPAVEIVDGETYVFTCVSANYDTLIAHYRRLGRKIVVPYEIEKQHFTVFNALNLLAAGGWIALNASARDGTSAAAVPADTVVHAIVEEKKDDNDDEQKPRRRNGRDLLRAFDRLDAATPSVHPSRAREALRRALGGGSSTPASANPRDASYPTDRQNADKNHALRPTLIRG